MQKMLVIIIIFTVSLFFISCSKENKIISDSKPVTEKKDPGKIKTELVYNITNPSKEFLLTKTEYKQDGKKIKMTSLFDDGKESETINYIYDDKGVLTKANVKWANFDEGFSKYTITYKYDEKGRLKSEKLSGDYATDVSPDLFEYVYGDNDKPTERLHYVTVIPKKPKDLQFRESYIYDSKGNKIEEVTKGIPFDYSEKVTYEYDDNNQIIKSIHTDTDGKVSKYRYGYEYY